MVVLVVLAVIIAIIAGIVASAKSESQAYENRLREVMEKETNSALRGYLDALEILNRVLQERKIGEVQFSIIHSAQPSTLVDFYLESYVLDRGWLQRNFFTIDVEADIRNRKKLQKEGKPLLPPLPEWESFYKSGTIWANLTDDELDSLFTRINKEVVKPDEPKFTKLVQLLPIYQCQENEIGLYLNAIAQTIRENFPHYDVSRETNHIMVTPRK